MKSDVIRSNLKKHRLRSVYLQLIIMVVALTTALAVISVIILFVQRSNMIKQAEKMQNINMMYTIEQFDELISNSYQAIYSVIGNNDVTQAIYNYDREIDSYAEDQEIRSAISQIYMVYSSVPNVSNVFIVQDKHDLVVDQDGVTEKNVYFKANYRDESAFWENLSEETHKFTLRISDDSSSLYVLQSVYYKNQKCATLCMELCIDNLYKRGLFQNFVEDRIVCVTNEAGSIVGYLSQNYDDDLVYKAIEKDGVDGYLFLKGSTSAQELNVIALVPMKIVTKEITPLFVLSLVVFVTATCLGVLASICITRRIYRPLYHAVGLIAVAGNRGGNNEFEVIENNVSAILEHNQTMTNVVNRSMPMVLETMFRRLIMDVDDNCEFEELLGMLDVEVCEGYYLTVVIYDEKETIDMEAKINMLFDNSILSLFERHKQEYVLILHKQYEDCRLDIELQCSELLDQTGVVIAIGKVYRDIYSIGKSYKDAQHTLDSRSMAVDENRVFVSTEKEEYVCYEISNNIENILYNYITSGNSKMVIDTIRQSLQENLDKGICFREYLNLISVYERYLIRMYENMDFSTQENIDIVPFSGTSFSRRTIEDRVKKMLDNYLTLTEFYYGNYRSETMDRIMKYLEENMDRDIGLEDVASAVGLTSNYITKYFKSKSGTNFKNCLTMKRMERAKELLLETELTIKDIAFRCGYNSSKQLIVNFTKVTGVSPTEYRKHHKFN